MNRYLNIVGFVALLAVWIAIADIAHFASPQLLPAFSDVIQRLYTITVNGTLLGDFWATMYRWVSGFVLGCTFGVAGGLILGLNPRFYKTIEFPIEFFRTLPVTAIFPLFLIIFGIGDASKIAMAFVPTFLLMLINSAYGVSHASKARIIMATVFGANQTQIFWRIVVFEALPQIFIGLRLALSLSMIVTVVSEMFIGSDKGLGQRIYDSYLTTQTTTLYAVLIVLGVLGYVLNKAIIFTEQRYVFWSGRS